MAATIACALHIWEAPLSEWKKKDIMKGSSLFLETFHTSWEALEDALDLQSQKWQSLQKSGLLHWKRLKQTVDFELEWKRLHELEFYAEPARWILFQWVIQVKNIIERISARGGIAAKEIKNNTLSPNTEKSINFHYVNWENDVISAFPAEQLTGKILHSCFKDSIIFERDDATVKYYYDRQYLNDVEKQCIGTKKLLHQHVAVFQLYDEAIVAILGQRVDTNAEEHDEASVVSNTSSSSNSVLRIQGSHFSWNCNRFMKISLKDVVIMLQPNSTEIFEGRIKKYDIKENGQHKWQELLADWACINAMSGNGKGVEGVLLRSRYLILSKLGETSGYFLRQEIFEERFGEIRILVYGLTPSGAIDYLVNRERIFELTAHCDPIVEQEKLANLETQHIAYIFSDRLEVRPSKGWQSFLNNGDLLPTIIPREVTLHVRKKRGPGRLAGRKVVQMQHVVLIVTIFELDNDTNTNEMRILVYEKVHNQTVEYRISSLERLILFRDNVPLINQIIDRLRIGYCNIVEDVFNGVEGRSMLVIGGGLSYKPHIPNFEVENIGDEYDIVFKDESSPDDSSSPKEESPHDEFLDSHEIEFQKERRNILKHKHDWVVYFDRSVVEEQKGNLVVYITLSVTQKGFSVITRDLRTYREAYKFISFHDACKDSSLIGKDLTTLLEELDNLDECVVYDLVDELMSRIDIDDSDDDGLYLRVSCDGDDTKPVFLAILTEHLSIPNEVMGKIKKRVAIHKVDLKITTAKNLAPLSQHTMRNPVCIAKWNLREIGRSVIMLQTVEPVWENCVFTTFTSRDATIEQSVLDIEIWDNDLKSVTHFLGCVRLQGEDLVSFLEEGEAKSFQLVPSTRLADSENVFAKGTLKMSGTAGVVQSQDGPSHDIPIISNESSDEALEFDEEVYLYIMTADKFPVGNAFRCVVHFNETKVLSSVVNATTDGILDFNDVGVTLQYPAKYSLGACQLNIEFRKEDSNESIYSLDLRGSDIVRLFSMSQPVSRTDKESFGEWFSLADVNAVKLNHPSNCRIQICGAREGNFQHVCSLQIPSAKNLAKLDLFGAKSDPFVKVSFNGHSLGQTSTLKNTSNPNWAAEEGPENMKTFQLTVPRWMEAKDCILELEVYGDSIDKDKTLRTLCLGVRVVVGEELALLLDGDGRLPVSMDLRKSDKPPFAKQTLVPKGEVLVKVKRRPSPRSSGAMREETQRIGVFEFAQNHSRQELIVKFLNMSNMPIFPEHTREVFVEALLNGRLIGKTASISNFVHQKQLALRSNANKLIRFIVPFGIALENLKLEFHVVAVTVEPPKPIEIEDFNAKSKAKPKVDPNAAPPIVVENLPVFTIIATGCFSGKQWSPVIELAANDDDNSGASRFFVTKLPLNSSNLVSTGDSSGEIELALSLSSQNFKPLMGTTDSNNPNKVVQIEAVTPVALQRETVDFHLANLTLSASSLQAVRDSISLDDEDFQNTIALNDRSQLFMLVIRWNCREIQRYFGNIKAKK